MTLGEQFESDGFLVLENFNSHEQCNRLMQRALELAGAFEINNEFSVFQTKNQAAIDEMIPLELKKGACIILHGHMPHYSQPNTNGRSRQAYAVHVVEPKAHYPSNNWLRRDAAKLLPL